MGEVKKFNKTRIPVGKESWEWACKQDRFPARPAIPAGLNQTKIPGMMRVPLKGNVCKQSHSNGTTDEVNDYGTLCN